MSKIKQSSPFESQIIQPIDTIQLDIDAKLSVFNVQQSMAANLDDGESSSKKDLNYSCDYPDLQKLSVNDLTESVDNFDTIFSIPEAIQETDVSSLEEVDNYLSMKTEYTEPDLSLKELREQIPLAINTEDRLEQDRNSKSVPETNNQKVLETNVNLPDDNVLINSTKTSVCSSVNETRQQILKTDIIISEAPLLFEVTERIENSKSTLVIGETSKQILEAETRNLIDITTEQNMNHEAIPAQIHHILENRILVLEEEAINCPIDQIRDSKSIISIPEPTQQNQIIGVNQSKESQPKELTMNCFELSLPQDDVSGQNVELSASKTSLDNGTDNNEMQYLKSEDDTVETVNEKIADTLHSPQGDVASSDKILVDKPNTSMEQKGTTQTNIKKEEIKYVDANKEDVQTEETIDDIAKEGARIIALRKLQKISSSKHYKQKPIKKVKGSPWMMSTTSRFSTPAPARTTSAFYEILPITSNTTYGSVYIKSTVPRSRTPKQLPAQGVRLMEKVPKEKFVPWIDKLVGQLGRKIYPETRFIKTCETPKLLLQQKIKIHGPDVVTIKKKGGSMNKEKGKYDEFIQQKS